MGPQNLSSSSRSDYASPEAVARLQGRVPQMLEELAALTDIESPSNNLDALGVCARYLGSMGKTLLGRAPEVIEAGGRSHLLWKFGKRPRIVLVGHYDTVHPLGTVLQFPFAVEGDIVRGPGVCDMKGGVIVALHALRDLVEELGPEALDGVCLMLNADEELGSPTSGQLIRDLAATAEYAIGFENAGEGWQIKTERRGCAHYEVVVHGRAAHAGDQAEKGINAFRELAAQTEVLCALADSKAGTSVTPTVASAGESINSVPGRASLFIDVRCRTIDEQKRVDEAVHKLVPLLTEATIEIRGNIEQPPLPEAASRNLFEKTQEVAHRFGLAPINAITVGGSADTCRFAGEGVQAIDGFGVVGGDDHSLREWIYVSSLPRQAALAAGLVERLLNASIDA